MQNIPAQLTPVKRVSGRKSTSLKIHVVDLLSPLADWPMTLCGQPAICVRIAASGEEPTCRACLRSAGVKP